jgi:hypothetical protein
MSTVLNEKAYLYAQNLVKHNKYVFDDRDAWSEHRPSAQDENDFIKEHGFKEYEKWHLGADLEQAEETKSRYKFPYGDFQKVHRCGVLAAESRSGQYDYTDIELAAAHLHGMIEAAQRRDVVS